MDTQALTGGFADAPIAAAHAFRAAMEAMARPGSIQTLTGAAPPAPLSVAAGALILTLCDPETPVWLAPSHDVAALRDWIAFHTGAPLTTPESAMFAIGDWAGLTPITRFPIGTPEYPDRSATLIVEMPALVAEGARLTGPGIRDAAALSLPEVQAFHDNATLFPLGLDFYFTWRDRAAALPRTTKVSERIG
jgi:alpha-D-ribose 1-methylphosphonate 5-triphosphate synthase subunit PhnH